MRSPTKKLCDLVTVAEESGLTVPIAREQAQAMACPLCRPLWGMVPLWFSSYWPRTALKAGADSDEDSDRSDIRE